MTPNETVFRIDPAGEWLPVFAHLLIGTAGHDFAKQWLELPSATDKAAGEIVEELSIGWPDTRRTKVIRSRDNARPKQVQPNTIRHHAGGQRVVRAGNPAGNGGAVAARLSTYRCKHSRRNVTLIGKQRRNDGTYLFSWHLGIPAKQHKSISELGAILLYAQHLFFRIALQ